MPEPAKMMVIRTFDSFVSFCIARARSLGQLRAAEQAFDAHSTLGSGGSPYQRSRVAIEKLSRHHGDVFETFGGSMLRLVTGALLALPACSSNDDTITEDHVFSDAQGRICRATLERKGESSPVVFSKVSCDGAGRECSSESTPCFQLSVAPDGTELRNCPACCKGSSSSFVSSQCNAVLCRTQSDCVYADASCTDGVCQCPGGRCE